MYDKEVRADITLSIFIYLVNKSCLSPPWTTAFLWWGSLSVSMTMRAGQVKG